ncbi:MAG: hypothetical protein JXR96_21675 [Deltaproteobacteria bacterium]|nr:hypothetical protein [Deltaproteobacteria bacterium]
MRRIIRLPAILFFFLPVSGCYGPLDILGMILESESSELEDDRIEDKHPEYDPGLEVTEVFDECEVTLNKSGSVTKLDLVPLSGEDEKYETRLFTGRAEAIDDLQGHGDAELIPSMEIVNGALKPFNDGLYAAVELGAQEGVEGIYTGKQLFLQDLLDALCALGQGASASQKEHIDAAATDVAAALMLGGAEPVAPAEILAAARSAASEFESKPLFSRPIGFYTWDETLEGIFRQDRFLQNYDAKLGGPYTREQFGKFGAVAAVLNADAGLLDRYQSILALYCGLTNPFAHYPATALLPYVPDVSALDDPEAVKAAFLADNPASGHPYPWCDAHFALFPSSYSKETRYYEELGCADMLEPDTNYMELFIEAIRSGEIDLEPDVDSGWYDYQTYALETLLLPERAPESDHLLLTAAYKKKLIETFKSILTQNRETHVKQLDIGFGLGAALEKKVNVYPQFPVEPFPTFYLRNARAYRFLETYLIAVMGEDFLSALQRLHEDGSRSEMSLVEELRDRAALLYGLHLVSCDHLGMHAGLLEEEMAEYDAAACRERALAWLDGWKSDQDVMKDPRVILPVQYDPATDTTHYWATIGVKVIKASAEFVEGYKPEVVEVQPGCEVDGFVLHRYYLLVEQFAEVARPNSLPPLTREEFRSICDRYDNAQAIVEALESE